MAWRTRGRTPTTCGESSRSASQASTGTAPRPASPQLVIYVSRYGIHTRPQPTLASRYRPPTPSRLDARNRIGGLNCGAQAHCRRLPVVATIRVQKLITSEDRGDDDISDLHVRQFTDARARSDARLSIWNAAFKFAYLLGIHATRLPLCNVTGSGEAQSNS